MIAAGIAACSSGETDGRPIRAADQLVSCSGISDRLLPRRRLLARTQLTAKAVRRTPWTYRSPSTGRSLKPRSRTAPQHVTCWRNSLRPSSMRDHGGVEKTGRLPSPLSLDGQPEGDDPDVGDVGYYAPGNDFVIWYGDQTYRRGSWFSDTSRVTRPLASPNWTVRSRRSSSPPATDQPSTRQDSGWTLTGS